MSEGIGFTVAGALAGARRCVPLAASTFAYGLVFGVLARGAGLRPGEVTLMSATVFAGAAQFVVAGLWGGGSGGVPVAEIVIATGLVNLRHLLMGAALHPWFGHLPARQRYGAAFFMTDENWALTLREFAGGGRDGAFLVGSGLALFAGWVSAGTIGALLGTQVPDPARWGLDFAATAVFTALLVGMWRGKGNLLPWATAATVATVAARWLPGQWYILLGALAGSAAGAWRDGR
jgi:4-azaleucine resistance transporter AzlC